MSPSVPLLLLVLSLSFPDSSSRPSRRFHSPRGTRLSSFGLAGTLSERCVWAWCQTDVNVFILQTSGRSFPGIKYVCCDVASSTHFFALGKKTNAISISSSGNCLTPSQPRCEVLHVKLFLPRLSPPSRWFYLTFTITAFFFLFRLASCCLSCFLLCC